MNIADLSERVLKSALLQQLDLEESFNAIASAQSDVDRCFHVASVQGSLPALYNRDGANVSRPTGPPQRAEGLFLGSSGSSRALE